MEGGSWTEDAATSRAVRLCFSLSGALAGLHRKTSRRGWESVTAAGVGVFLDWLTCRPQFGEGTRGTRLEEFQHVMACIVEFANGIIRSAATAASGRGDGYSGGGGSGFAVSAASKEDGPQEGEADAEIDPDTALWEDEVSTAYVKEGTCRPLTERECYFCTCKKTCFGTCFVFDRCLFSCMKL